MCKHTRVTYVCSLYQVVLTDLNKKYPPTINEHKALPPPSQPTPAVAIIWHPRHTSPRSIDISTFVTQNVHRLRRLPQDTNGKLITTKPYNYTCYQHLVAMMKTKSIDVYFVQETWLVGDAFDKVINGYHVFRHNGGKGTHNFRGVAISLSPRYYQGWRATGARPPLTTNATSDL